LRGFAEQGDGAQDLAALAVAALGDVHVVPGALHRMCAGRIEAFDGRDLAAFHFTDRHQAGLDRLAVHQHHATPAQPDAATVFRADQVEMVSQRPEQGRVPRQFQFAAFAVDLQIHLAHAAHSAGIDVELPDS
jgi:hypothetical protein